ncbi:MAG: hypothetical protein ACE5KT_10860 [Methanosarcinales archaeon]
MKCNDCGFEMNEENFEIEDSGITTKAWVCSQCHNIVFDEKESEIAIEEYAEFLKHEKPVLTLKRKVSKIGDEIGILFPKDLVDSLNIKIGTNVEMYPIDKHRVVLEIENE